MSMGLKIKTWDSEGDIGYKQITTFFEDFSIADNFGVKAIQDTYDRAFKGWKDNYKYLTELVLVLNKKCWQHHGEGNQKYSELYSDLFYKAKDYALDNLKDDEFRYFWEITD